MRSHPDALTIPIDATICSADGERIGRVAEVTGSHFKVDAPRRRDFWLSNATVQEAGPDTVRLLFNEDQLDAYVQSEPSADAATPAVAESAESFESPGEVEERRHRMAHPGSGQARS